jgi:hypothetical protein
MPASTVPPPPKRNPHRLSLFDFPTRVRARIYSHYFTYPEGLHCHLVYSGHFPRPSPPTSRSKEQELLTPPESPSDDDSSEWPWPNEARFASTNYLLSTTQREALLGVGPVEQTERLYEPGRESPTMENFPGRVSVRKRLREEGVSDKKRRGNAWRMEAALLRCCKRVSEEAGEAVWRENKVFVVTDARIGVVGRGAEEDGDFSKDGRYHLHLGVLPRGLLKGVRELVLPARGVVSELPGKSVRAGDLVVQRRVWEVIEREMPGLRKVEVEVAEQDEVKRFLAWVVEEMASSKPDMKVLVEVGEVRGMIKHSLRDFVVPAKSSGGTSSGSSASSTDRLVGKMSLPRDLRTIKMRLLLQRDLWPELERLRWGQVSPVRIGRQRNTVIYDGDVIGWDSCLYQMSVSKGERKYKPGEELQTKVYEPLKKAASHREEEPGRKESLTDKVYEKLRLKN